MEDFSKKTLRQLREEYCFAMGESEDFEILFREAARHGELAETKNKYLGEYRMMKFEAECLLNAISIREKEREGV